MKPVSSFDDFSMGKTYGFRELTLAEMLGDPIVRDLMRSDRVTSSDIRKILGGRGARRFALAA
jgi:hypothetical protein